MLLTGSGHGWARPIKQSAQDAVHLTASSSDKHTLVRVWENGGSHYVVVDESQTG